jgi:hypothetical protein
MRFTQDNLDYNKQQFDDVVTAALSADDGGQVTVIDDYLKTKPTIANDDIKVLKNLVCYYEILSGENQISGQNQGEAKTNAAETLIKEVIAVRKSACLQVIGQADVAAQEPITLDDLYVIDIALQIGDPGDNLVNLINRSVDFATRFLCGLAQTAVLQELHEAKDNRAFIAFSDTLLGTLNNVSRLLVAELTGTESGQGGNQKLQTIQDNLTNLPNDSLSQLQSNVKNWARMKATVSNSLLPSATKEEKEARTRTSSLGSHNSSGRTTPTDVAVALDAKINNDADNGFNNGTPLDDGPTYCETVVSSWGNSFYNLFPVAEWATNVDNSAAWKVAGFIPSAGTNIVSSIRPGSHVGRNVYVGLDFLAGGFALFLTEAIAALIPPLQTTQDGSWSLKSKKALSVGRGGLIGAAVVYGLFALVALAVESQHNQNNFSCVTGKGWEQAVVWDFKDCVYSCELDKKRLNATFFNESLPLGKVTFGKNVTDLVNFDRQCKSFKGKLEGATCVVEPKDTATKTVPPGAFSFLYRLSVSNNHTFMGQKTAQCDLFGQLIVSGQGVNHTTPTPTPGPAPAPAPAPTPSPIEKGCQPVDKTVHTDLGEVESGKALVKTDIVAFGGADCDPRKNTQVGVKTSGAITSAVPNVTAVSKEHSGIRITIMPKGVGLFSATVTAGNSTLVFHGMVTPAGQVAAMAQFVYTDNQQCTPAGPQYVCYWEALVKPGCQVKSVATNSTGVVVEGEQVFVAGTVKFFNLKLGNSTCNGTAALQVESFEGPAAQGPEITISPDESNNEQQQQRTMMKQ